MSGYTLAQAQAKLDMWMSAEDAVATGQEYTIGQRRLVRANLSEIREAISFWNSEVQKLTASRTGPKIWGASPL